MSLPRKYMVEKRVCGTCVHYRQHYVRSREGYYIPLWYGHCIHPWRRCDISITEKNCHLRILKR